MTATTTTTGPRSSGALRSVPVGVVGGLVGGTVFGLMVQLMGMVGMVGMLVGSEPLADAWGVHLATSAAIGAGFGLLLAPRVTGLATGPRLGTVVALAAGRPGGPVRS